ncbi:MAG: zinc ribbon domain-containing protein [Gemmatimonadales bacterium]
MTTDLEALLALQAEDVSIHGLEERLAALEPRIRELDQRKQRTLDAIGRSSAAVAAEEKKQAWLRDKLAEHKLLVDRNQAQMDAVKTMKQATAAVAQMDQARKIVAGEESDLVAINRRLEELRGVLNTQQNELAGVELEQEQARADVASQRTALGGELEDARAARAKAAELVPAVLRSKYDRIRGRKRVEAVFAMSGMSCGNCDTAIPMQRRHVMNNTGMIELCEACGVLMYFPG